MKPKPPLTEIIRRKFDMAVRRATAGQRRLPGFLLLGAAKSGTTSLYNYLVQHPCIQPCFQKEVHFFDYKFSKGPAWYRSFFPKTNARPPAGCDRILTGESSPYYLYHPLAPQRVKAILPQARFFVLLRHPVDRAVSHYNHRVRAGKESLPIEEAFAAEPGRIAGEAERLESGATDFSFNHFQHSYLDRGRYARQLERWFRLFDRDRFMIIDSAELFNKPEAIFNQACAHLGLEPTGTIRFKAYNEGEKEAYSHLDPAYRRELVNLFREDNEKLYRLLDKKFDWND